MGMGLQALPDIVPSHGVGLWTVVAQQIEAILAGSHQLG